MIWYDPMLQWFAFGVFGAIAVTLLVVVVTVLLKR